MWVRLTISDNLATVDLFTLKHIQITPLGDQLFILLTIFVGDNHALLTLGFLAEGNGTGLFRQNCTIFWFAGFKQVGNPRQTTGNVTGLGRRLWQTGDNLTNLHSRSVGRADNCTSRQRVLHRNFGAFKEYVFTAFIQQAHSRTQLTTSSRTVLRIHYLNGGKTCYIVHLGLNRYTVGEITEVNTTGYLGNDRMGMWIPRRYFLTCVHLRILFYRQDCTVWQLVAFLVTTVFVYNPDFTGTGHRHQLAILVANSLDVEQVNLTRRFDRDTAFCRRPASGTTDVEGTHGQLGSRFTDGLCCNNADGFTLVDHMTTCQITSIAVGAYTITGFAGNRRTHHDFVNRQRINLLDPCLIQEGSGRNQHFIATGNILCHHTTEYTFSQRLYHITTLDDRAHTDTLFGSAVINGNNHVLRHVNQTTGQITGVRGFECGICQTFPCTVGGDEVLKYVQTFAEIGSDRCFNDGAIRLGHQTTHPGKLTNLGSGTPRPGIGHHIDGIEGFLHNGITISIDHFFLADLFHHRFGDFLVGTSPDVNDLVVAFALCYQAAGKLVFNLQHSLFCFCQQVCFLFRDHHVIRTKRNARTGRITVAGIHQLVSKNDCRLQTNPTV